MTKILLRKQLAEIFRTYLYDAKKNKARSKGTVIAYFVLFALLMVGLLGGMFTFLAFTLRSTIVSGYGWFYYLIFALAAVCIGAFGSVFNTFSGLYLSRDNDLLLSMPIPVHSIMASRLLTVFLMGLMYSGVGLDPKAAHILKGMMREHCDAGGAIFFSTHVLEVAEKLCDKVAIIRRGQLVRSGTMDEVRGDDSLEEVFLELEEDVK